MDEITLKIILAIVCPLTVLLVIGGVKLRDMILKQEREQKWLEDDLKELKIIYEKDKVERNSLMTMATSIDTKIDAKLKDVLEKIAEQRRQDTAMFSQAVSDLNATLGKVNLTLEYMGKDIDGIKKTTHNV